VDIVLDSSSLNEVSAPEFRFGDYSKVVTSCFTQKELDRISKGENAEIIERFPGEALVGTEYEPLFDLPVNFRGKKGYRVVADDYVTLTDGTGVVHIAPAFGEDDNRVGKTWDLPFLQLVNTSGHMCGGTPWDGLFVKDADKPILEALKESGKLFAALPFEHSYPFCWRCDTPLIYYARESWFIKMTAVKDKLIAFNKSVNWIPETIGEGRMGNFLENVIDWGISRERYWGTPLPVWMCDCGHVHVIGSREELKKMSRNCPENIELHKPYIDQVEVICPVCGKIMKREPVVIDCWFDSGSMPFAQWHYPFENKEEFERRYPAAFISEAVDQTRGWFYTLMAVAACLFDKAPFENCVVLGLVCDKDGKKMSKHIGNVIAPADVLDKQGADAVRWYFYTASAPWLPSRFSGEAVSEYQRKFMSTIWNTYAFYVLYADIDGFDPTKHSLKRENLSLMDRWILSRLQTLTKRVDGNLEAFRITEAGRELIDFADELSNWYVRRCRDRYWGAEMTDDKEAAYMTLYTVLKTVTLLTAPFCPFMTEAIYQNIVRSVDGTAPISVHLNDYPAADDSFIDAELEDEMAKVLNIVTVGRSARSTAGQKTRQPLSKMYVQGEALSDRAAGIAAEELNVKEIVFIENADALMSYKVKPQLRTLGPRYGKLLGKISAHLAAN
ncbi:MAG: isoleucine--tRNA ligase, partial [Clostridia bacterium]|nr:isoleucine--tRNA ligase [Clostridia bacterium]